MAVAWTVNEKNCSGIGLKIFLPQIHTMKVKKASL